MKKSICISFCLLTFSINVSAYSFKTPDWGELLMQKKAYVSNVELDLYAQGGLDKALYFGAKNEQRSGVYFGMVAEETKGIEKPISSYLTYFELSDQQENIYYPANELIEKDNVIATIGWTVTSVNDIESQIDTVRKTLDNLAKYKKPMFIRFANEMNISSIGDDPEQYIKAFRIVANIIHEYDQFATVWSPNDMGALDRPFDYYYPGDEYVDWVGASSYLKPYFLGNPNTTKNDSIYFMTGDYAWSTNAVKPIIDFMAKNNIQKPLMLSESGVANEIKSGEDYTYWAEPRLRNMYYYLIMRYPQIKLINYFNKKMDSEEQYYNISEKSYLLDIMNEALNSGAYIREYGENAKFTFTKANEAGILTGNTIPLYTYAYIPEKEHYSVNYNIDGAFYHSSNTIPYKCNFNPNDFIDGQHNLEITLISDGNIIKTNKYVFYKKASSIIIRNSGVKIDPEEIPNENPSTVIDVIINGIKVEFDVQPIIINGRTMVPLRKIFETLGAKVTWEDATKTVEAIRGSTTLKLIINSKDAIVNGVIKTMDVPSIILDNRTLVPARFISESLGCKVNWDSEHNTVLITD